VIGVSEEEFRFRLAIALSLVGLVLTAFSTYFAWVGIWNWITAGLAFVGIVCVGIEVLLLAKIFRGLKARGVF
jgi:multisubunit Na+/H+ antiporter MnhB subunit